VKRRLSSILILTAVPLIAIGLAACGGSSDSSTTSAATGGSTTASAAGGSTVSTMSVSGVGTALVDSKGNVLYTNDQDTASKIACTGPCASIWVPVAAPSSGKPTSDDSSVQAKLGVVKAPDGTSQVTFGGKPLYTFVEDTPGQSTGNGFMDSFNGTSFTWTAATSGKAPSSGGTTSTAGATGGTGSAGRGSSQSSGGYAY
jgi:predicted lipoprotein with Yx(FWY)xxD motif